MDISKHKKRGTLGVFAVLVVAAVLRIYNLGAESLWIDEGNSLRDAYIETISRASKPLYYWILSFWVKFAHTEAALRSLSVIFGVASVLVLYLIGKELISRRAGLIAGMIMAVSPLHINHSQEIRMYELLTLCALVSSFLLYHMMSRWSKGKAVGYVVWTWLMLLTHPLTVFLLPAHALYILLFWKQHRASVFWGFACLAAVALLWSPWIPGVITFGQGFVRTQSWAAEAERITSSHIPFIYGQYFYGEWNRLSYGDRLLIRYAHYAYAFMITAAAIVVWLAVRRRRETWLLGTWALLPVALMVILSMALDRSWPIRYLLYTSPALYLLVAWPLSKIPDKLMWIAVALLLALPGFRLARYYQKTVHPQWREAMHYLHISETPSDIIYIYKPSNRFIFDYYYRGKAKWKALGIPGYAGDICNFEDHVAQKVASAAIERPHSWLILSRNDKGLPDQVERELTARGVKLIRHRFYEIDLFSITAK